MSSDEYTKLADWLMQIEKRLEIVEGASPLRANTEQPLVGPPGNQTESPPRWPDRDALSKFRSWLEDRVKHYRQVVPSDSVFDLLFCEYEEIFHWLDTYDQGPVAKKPPGPKSPKQVPGQRYGV